jgi:rhamnose utilization protein RhaD (predicted bifunctional aldolase and dehydrogenase)
MNPEVDALIEMSRIAGARPDWVQAAGGNTSVKSRDKLYVKASGCRLADMDATRGWVALELGKARKVLNDPRYDALPRALQQDEAGRELLTTLDPKSPAGARPSLEAEFHLLGPRICLHLHVVEVLAGLSLKAGRAWFESVLSGSGLKWAWVDYRPPGHSLAKLVQAAGDVELVLMKNHGVIAYAQSAPQAFELIQRLQEAVLKALGPQSQRVGPPRAWAPLCPDDVIYPESEELRAANARAAALGSQIGELEPLNPRQCEELLAMEGEKYRQSLK